MASFADILWVTFKSALRDRVLHGIALAAVLLILLVPVFSLFSMRQVQELSITLSLSGISFILLVLSVLLGASSVWRDIERRYAASVLGLPISRRAYILGKFGGIALFLMLASALLGVGAMGCIAIARGFYPSEVPIQWGHVLVALTADSLKSLLLVALAMLFSSLSTSFFLPIFGTIAVYFAGSAAQEVMDFVSSGAGQSLPAAAKGLVKVLYYILPNLAAFDFKVQAVYPLPLPTEGVVFTLLYFLLYTAILLSLAVTFFSRRELP